VTFGRRHLLRVGAAVVVATALLPLLVGLVAPAVAVADAHDVAAVPLDRPERGPLAASPCALPAPLALPDVPWPPSARADAGAPPPPPRASLPGALAAALARLL
jgi:hypothetical protein